MHLHYSPLMVSELLFNDCQIDSSLRFEREQILWKLFDYTFPLKYKLLRFLRPDSTSKFSSSPFKWPEWIETYTKVQVSEIAQLPNNWQMTSVYSKFFQLYKVQKELNVSPCCATMSWIKVYLLMPSDLRLTKGARSQTLLPILLSTVFREFIT